MRMVICSVPLRETPDTFPPLGATRVMDALLDTGYKDVYFYNWDLIRREEEDILAYFREKNPDIIGISAVVSTSYAYVKWLSHLLKKHFPQATQILGGNMAASAEVILRKCPIDLCVVGDGEGIIVELARHWDINKNLKVNNELRQVKGIVFLDPDKNDETTFTGYAPPLERTQIRQINYEILRKNGGLDYYLPEGVSRYDFLRDPRSHEPHRKGKKMAYVMTSKGCVARCTFCHRWEKGYKALPVDDVINEIKYLKEKYDVGFISIADENFGSDRKQVEEFIEKIIPLDVLWYAAGMRVRSPSANEEIFKMLRDSGCVAIYFGIESGSDKMLQVMEKRASVADNLRALELCKKAGLYTVIQLVIGMPGETNETIKETCSFVQKAIDILKNDYRLLLSTNYAQALPGTPLFEYARSRNIIAQGLEEEEAYLLKISDVEASDVTHYSNLTEEKISDVLIWRDRLALAAVNFNTVFMPNNKIEQHNRGNYFRFNFENPLLLYVCKLMGESAIPLLKLRRCRQRAGSWKGAFALLNEKNGARDKLGALSLRKIMQDTANHLNPETQPLRDGR